MFDNPLWTCEPFDRAHAWIDLIGLAAYKDGYFMKRGNQIEQPRGWVCVSQKGLADRWRWSVGKVDRFLKFLENEKQIVIDVSHVTTRLQIVNYDQYQYKRKTDEKQTENRQKTDEKQTETINTGNTSNTVKENYTPAEKNFGDAITYNIKTQHELIYDQATLESIAMKAGFTMQQIEEACIHFRLAKLEEGKITGTLDQYRAGLYRYCLNAKDKIKKQKPGRYA